MLRPESGAATTSAAEIGTEADAEIATGGEIATGVQWMTVVYRCLFILLAFDQSS